VRGHSLNGWAQSIQERNTYSRDFLKVAISIAAALDVAHRCVFTGNLGFQETGVLHGDIKPSNILVEDSTSIPIILDFMIPDLQRLVQNRCQQSSNWKKDPNGLYEYDAPLTGAFGTPGFMSPEQELEGIVTPCSDVYSLGWTLIRSFWAARSEDGFLAAKWIRAKQGGFGVMHQRLCAVLDAMIEPQPGGSCEPAERRPKCGSGLTTLQPRAKNGRV
jgi:serine/threonine protein kinase